MTKIVMVLLALSSALLSQSFKWRALSLDKWKSEHGTVVKYDKLEHAGACFVMESVFHYTLPRKWKRFSMPASFGIGLLWEVKDGFAYDKKWGSWGSQTEGFSWKDLLADAGGVLISSGFRWAAPRVFRAGKIAVVGLIRIF